MNNDETTCPDCAETIKAAAKVCKHCGSRFDSQQNRTVADATHLKPDNEKPLHSNSGMKEWHVLMGGAILLAIGIFFIYLTSSALDRPPPSNANIEVEGLAYMKRDLLDPSSVQFAELSPSADCLRGKMNAKNGFGAYTGFVDFYYDAKTKFGRVSPGFPDLGPGGSKAFNAGMKDYDAYNRERSVCLLGEEKTAQNEAAVAKRIADEKAAKAN